MAKVRVNIDLKVPKKVKDFIIENEEAVAKTIEQRAKASTLFKDYKGSARESKWTRKAWGGSAKKLRKSIRAKRSKYPDGGWIVQANAPHAFLVEVGHDLIDWRTGKKIGHVEGTKFLRTAKEEAISEAMRLFGAK